jgi:hypothetical protein
MEFTAELWEYDGEAAWVFVTLPHEVADEIADRATAGPGFGSVPVVVRIGSTEWRTSLFPDKRAASYVLPVKRVVRRAEGVEPGDIVSVRLELDPDRAPSP